jgi:hypothetical protein
MSEKKRWMGNKKCCVCQNETSPTGRWYDVPLARYGGQWGFVCSTCYSDKGGSRTIGQVYDEKFDKINDVAKYKGE